MNARAQTIIRNALHVVRRSNYGRRHSLEYVALAPLRQHHVSTSLNSLSSLSPVIPRACNYYSFRRLSSKPPSDSASIPSKPQPVSGLAGGVDQSELTQNAALQEATGRDLVLSPPALVITREYEWANILVGFEQANKYSIRAAPGGEVVGHLAEESSIGRALTRNVLRTHRPFKATVFDKHNNVIFVMRRPMYLISTQIFVETSEGEVLGEVHMDWHMWRRRYKLFVDKQQFAAVDSGLLAVDFDMRDVDGRKIASVNKDFTGFARELFTDARQYVIRLDPSFGLQAGDMLVNDAATVDVPTEDYSEFKMGHRERAVILATAISIDFDYFSVHSRGMNPGLMMMPPVGGGAPAPSPGAAGGAGAVAGADVLSDSMGGAESDNPYAVPVDDGGADQGGFGGDSGSAYASGDETDQTFGQDTQAEDSQWAQFEEPDHGFDDSFQEDTWTADNDPWSGGGGGEEEAGGGLFGLIRDIFFSDD